MKSPRQSQPTPMRPPFVVHNPYGALRSGQAAAVTPDMVHGQASGKRPPEPRFSAGPTATGSTSTGGRVRHRTEFEGTNHWEEGDNENDSGLRQAPALVGVQDVYPPELSRLVIRGARGATCECVYGTINIPYFHFAVGYTGYWVLELPYTRISGFAAMLLGPFCFGKASRNFCQKRDSTLKTHFFSGSTARWLYAARRRRVAVGTTN